ncbi:MAG: cytochrome c [Nitrospira sp.]|nr:cytochrome c [Nitrospira sp.]
MNVLAHALFILLILIGAIQGSDLWAAGGDASKGKPLYEENCMVCHGRGGKGDGYRLFNPPPADLTSSAVQEKLDAALLRTIHEGRPNTAMGTWKYVLSDEEARDVLAYVRSLSR